MERSIRFHRNAERTGNSMKLHRAISGVMAVKISGLSPITYKGEYFEIVCAPIQEQETKIKKKGGKRIQSHRHL
jgi:hypothetical protein